MTVRCKFKCMQKHKTEDGFEIQLSPVTCGSKENEAFFKWTPHGSFYFGTVNPTAAEQFEVGKEYYIDISCAESEGKA